MPIARMAASVKDASLGRLAGIDHLRCPDWPEASLRPTTGGDEWRSLLKEQVGATPFHAWEWLEWVAPFLQCRFLPLVVLDQAGEAVGVAPLLLKRRGPLTTGNWVPFPYLGPLVPLDLLGPTLASLRRLGRRLRLVELQVAAHPLSTEPLAIDATYRALGFDSVLDQTYLISLAGRDIEEIHAALSQPARYQLRKMPSRGLELRPSTPQEVAELLPRIHEANLRRQGLKPTYSAALGPQLASRPPAIPLRITSAVCDGITVGLIATLGGNIAMLWMGGVLEEYRSTHATVALYWDAIKWAHSRSSSYIDLVGLPTPGIAAFKKLFGGQLYDYPVGHRILPSYERLRQLSGTVETSWMPAIRRHLLSGAADPVAG